MLKSSRYITGCFAPCVNGEVLLKTWPATVKRAGLAQKVLLFSRRSEIQPGLGSLIYSGFNRNLMNTVDLKRRGVSRGETSRWETQQYKYNLTTKGRNQRQINE